MINPLLVATNGYLGYNKDYNLRTTLGISVDGYLIIKKIDEKPELKPKIRIKGLAMGNYIYDSNSKLTDDFLKKEDEEILIIIKTFVQCQ